MLSLLLAVLLSLSAVEATPVRQRRAAKQGSVSVQSLSQAQLQQLNQTVQGKLYRGYPYGRPCFTNAASDVAGSFNLNQCTQVQSGWKDDLDIIASFGGYMNTNWGYNQRTGDRCDLDYNLPQNPLAYAPTKQCRQGSVPYYYVDARSPSDVQAAILFAKNTSVPLVVKSSGHDYKGRSSAPNSLGLWMHNYQYTKFNPSGSFCGAAAGPIINHGAGVPFIDLYKFADANGVTYVGGSSETVTAGGGWLAGGGHSSASNLYGLGVDRVQQISSVLPNGTIVTSSRCQNPDIFFAQRGGGGSAFGVVTDVWYSAAPKLTLQTVYIKFLSLDSNSASKFLQIIIANAVKWGQEGWGGYIEPAALSKMASGMVLTTPKLTLDQAKASMKPITDFASTLGNLAVNNNVSTSNSYLDYYNTFLVPNEELVGLGDAIASRFVPDTNFATNASQAQLLSAMNAAIAATPSNVLNIQQSLIPYGGAPVQILVTSPYNYPDDHTSAVTPAWRNTLWHVLFAPTWSYATGPSDIAKLWSQANAAAQKIRDITVPGAYQNEASIFTPDPVADFWGQANYNKLVAIKNQIDPDNVLTCWQCINWDSTDPRYQSYPQQV